MAEKASKWPKNPNSTRIIVTEAGSWKKFLLNGANSRFRNERGFEEKYVNE